MDGPARRRRVIVYGAFFPDWNAALADRALWRAIPGVTEVLRLHRAAQVAELPPSSGDTVIIPLGEDHIRHCPAGYRSLIPEPAALRTLCDKARFAAFMAEAGLASLCPVLYRSREEASFPCVLKRVDLSGSRGVVLVTSPADLEERLRSALFDRQRHLLQAFVPGDTEYVLHGVCRDGEILWRQSYARPLGPAPRIGGLGHDTEVPVDPAPRVVSQIAGVLARLRYSGPCCVDYKLLPGGDVALFEINPRFGGSLMSPGNREALRQALDCLIANAR